MVNRKKDIIPLKKLNSSLDLFVKYIDGSFNINNTEKNAHRDEYFTFILLESGICQISIDFNNIEIPPHSVLYTRPGQVHTI